MKYIIDRRTWLRAEGSDRSKLYRPIDGKMCCLGQICLQEGLRVDQIYDRFSPFHLSTTATKKIKWMFEDKPYPKYLKQPIRDMMQVNDSKVSDEEIEEKLIKLAKELDIELEFIN